MIRFAAALFFGALALVTGVATAQPVTVEGVKFEPSATVGGQPLVLNGAGLRTRAIFKVYAAGLYVPQKSSDPVALIAQTGARRVSIGMLRDVDAATFASSLLDGLKSNHTEEQLSALKTQIEQLQATFKSVGEAKKGDAIQLDWVPGTGTRIVVNGQSRGEPIAGAAFFAALLRIWLGDKPADGSLKKAMLGG
jgi:Chalcone isomerase-like